MWIRCQSWPDSKVDRTYSLNHKIYHTCERNVDTIAQVGTISAYLSLSEGGFGKKERMWARSSKLALSRRTFHYPKVDVGPKLKNVGTIGCGFGPTSIKVGTIATTIKAKLSKVGTIGPKIEQSGHYRDQLLTTIQQSGHYRDQLWTKIEQHGHYRAQLSKVGTIGGGFGPTLCKVGTIGANSGQVGTIRGGCSPRVDLGFSDQELVDGAIISSIR